MNYLNCMNYLKENPPFDNNEWDKEKLYHYLVYSCCKVTQEYIDEYFSKYTHDENLLKLLEKYSDLLSETGKNPVATRNPLKYME